MLDFPSSSLSVGQKYPVTPIAGIPQYTWDGEKWTTVGSGSATTAPPASALPLMDATPAVVGVTTKYAREDHVHPTDSSMLQKSANLSDVANVVTARQSIYAAPFDAMAYSGMQINGSTDVSQERGYNNPVTVGNNTYFCDGWMASKNGSTMAGSAQCYAGSVGAPFQNSAVIGISAAQATILSGDFFLVSQPFEGYRIQRLMWGTPYAQPLTLGFWTVHHRTGIYSGSIRNADGSRSCAFTYSQIASDIAEYKTVTIPGCLDGTWPIGNAASMSVTFAIAAGATFTAPSAGVWYSGLNYLAGPGQINGVAATTDAFRITGVVILPGIEAPSAARSALIMRPYDQELVTCKRYWQKSYGAAVAPGTVDNSGMVVFYIDGLSSATHSLFNTVNLGTSMRAAPTVMMYSPSTGAAGKATDAAFGVDVTATASFSSNNSFVWSATGSGASPSVNMRAHYTADARL